MAFIQEPERELVEANIRENLMANARGRNSRAFKIIPTPQLKPSSQQVRVKFEHGVEKAIVVMDRPLTLQVIWKYVSERFGKHFNLYYYSDEVKGLQAIFSQGDIDKAVEIYDSSLQSQLKITLLMDHRQAHTPSPHVPNTPNLSLIHI